MYEAGATLGESMSETLGEWFYALLVIFAVIAAIFLIWFLIIKKKNPSSGTEKFRSGPKTVEKKSKFSDTFLNSGEKEMTAGFRVPEDETDNGAESPPGTTSSEALEKKSAGDIAEKIRESSPEHFGGEARAEAQKRRNSGKRPEKETVVFYQYDRGDVRKITCSHCGMENDPGERRCNLCGAYQEKGA